MPGRPEIPWISVRPESRERGRAAARPPWPSVAERGRDMGQLEGVGPLPPRRSPRIEGGGASTLGHPRVLHGLGRREANHPSLEPHTHAVCARHTPGHPVVPGRPGRQERRRVAQERTPDRAQAPPRAPG